MQVTKEYWKVLLKTSKEQLLTYQRRQPKLSDLELISLSLTAEFMGIDSENDLFRKLPKNILSKITRSLLCEWCFLKYRFKSCFCTRYQLS